MTILKMLVRVPVKEGFTNDRDIPLVDISVDRFLSILKQGNVRVLNELDFRDNKSIYEEVSIEDIHFKGVKVVLYIHVLTIPMIKFVILGRACCGKDFAMQEALSIAEQASNINRVQFPYTIIGAWAKCIGLNPSYYPDEIDTVYVDVLEEKLCAPNAVREVKRPMLTSGLTFQWYQVSEKRHVTDSLVYPPATPDELGFGTMTDIGMTMVYLDRCVHTYDVAIYTICRTYSRPNIRKRDAPLSLGKLQYVSEIFYNNRMSRFIAFLVSETENSSAMKLKALITADTPSDIMIGMQMLEQESNATYELFGYWFIENK